MIVEVDCRGLSLVVSAVGKFWCEVGVDGTVFMAWQHGCCPICYESRDILYILYGIQHQHSYTSDLIFIIVLR